MIAALFAAALLAAPGSAGPPAGVKPLKVIGPGLYVRDLQAEEAWYEAKLGMRVVFDLPQFHEAVLGFGDDRDAAVLSLQASDRRPAGENLNGRVILGVPDAKGLAAWLTSQGVETHEAIRNVAYFLHDPEKNPIELYTPPAGR